jgi:cholesterol transport system auxiliary component
MEKEARPVSKRCIQLSLVALLAWSMAACSGSRPVKYYVIDPGPAPARASAPLPITLLVARVTAAHVYRDDRLVYSSGPVQLGLQEYERWASPPADMMQDLLIASLRATGQYRSISRVTSSVRGDYIVRGHLNSLDEVDKPTLAGRFSLQLELFDPKAQSIVWAETYTHDEPVNGKTVPDVVEALDRNVRTGINQLTASMGQYLSAHPGQ